MLRVMRSRQNLQGSSSKRVLQPFKGAPE
jgi:hypothetical protein